MKLHDEFESCVVLEGNQTKEYSGRFRAGFESCVVLEGNQTDPNARETWIEFESCVVLEGNQTIPPRPTSAMSLRVVLF